MKKIIRVLIFISVFAIPAYSYAQKKAQDVSYGQHQMPHLIKQDKTTQLIVDDKLFLILAGELGLMLPVQV